MPNVTTSGENIITSIPDSFLIRVANPGLGNNKITYANIRAQLVSLYPNLVFDLTLKEDKANKGVANGYASLGAGGTIPLIQLPFSATAFLGVYNASTNTPALLDGTGTNGQWYWTTVGGTNNYGSGNVTLVANQAVVYNGTIWQAGAVIAGSVVSVNGATGVVVLDLDDIPDSTTRFAVTANENDALANSPTPANAGNPYVTLADIGGIAVGTQWHTPENHADGKTLGSGTPQTLISLGYDNPTAAAIWTLVPSIDVTLDTIDTVALYQASLLLENGSRQNELHSGLYGAREYRINRAIPLGRTTAKRSSKFLYDLHGSTIRATGTNSLFESVPTSQAIAATWINREITIQNGFIEGVYGSKGNGQTAIRIGASVEARFPKLEIAGCDVSFDLMWCMFAGIEQCRSTNSTTHGFWIHCGLDAAGSPVWTSASLSNSASNVVYMLGCRGLCALGSDYGTYLQGVSDISIRSYTSEGTESATQSNQGKAAIFFDDMNSTVVKGFDLDVMHAEQSYTDALIKIKAREGTFYLGSIYNALQGFYATENRNILSVESYAGALEIILSKFKYATQFQQFQVISDTNGRMYFDKCALNGLPTDVTDLQANAAMWTSNVPDFLGINPLL